MLYSLGSNMEVDLTVEESKPFTAQDRVYPRWSQYLPAFTVVDVGPVMIKIVDEWGNKEYMHKDDLVHAE